MTIKTYNFLLDFYSKRLDESLHNKNFDMTNYYLEKKKEIAGNLRILVSNKNKEINETH